MQLSIITISYKNIQELKETLDSINNQVTNCHENVLVLSGYSAKEKKEITQSYSSDFRKFYWDLDNSLFNAMNVGIEKASGDYLLFLNAGDCFVNSDCINLINNRLSEKKCISFKTYQIYNNIRIIRDNEPTNKIFVKSGLRTVPPHQGFLAPNKKELFYDENLKVSADNDWMNKNINKYGIIYSGEIIVDFKLGGQSTFPTIEIIFVKLKHEKFIRFLIECAKFIYSLFVTKELYFITMAKIRGYKIIKKKLK